MKKAIWNSIALAVLFGAWALVARAGNAGGADAIVRLQSSTPGVQQIGHSNVSGTVTAGQFVGNGAGITALNADDIATGTLGVNRLPAAAALLTTAQVFVGAKTFAVAPSFTAAAIPFNVSSSNVVTNLNADLIDGIDSAAFPQLASANTWTGVNTFGNASNSFSGSGAGLTALNATQLTTGTLPNARLSGTYSNALTFSNGTFTGTHSGNGSGLTSLDAGSLSTGTVASARISGNYSLITGVGTITSGTWLGTILAPSVGGTGINTSTTPTGSLLYTSAVGTWNTLPVGSTGQVLTLSGGIPTWGAAGGLTLPYSGTANTTSPTSAFKIANSGTGSSMWGQNSDANGTGILGEATFTGIGTSYGVYGTSGAQSGYGVYGLGASTTGFNYGVYGQSNSQIGYGVYGRSTSASGQGYGLYGRSDGTSGYGVFGLANAITGQNYGGRFETNSNGGYGVYGLASSTSGTTYGVFGANSSTSGRGVVGYASATSGSTFGGSFQSDSTSGTAVFGWALASSGSNFGGSFRTDSSSGTGVFGTANATTGATIGVKGNCSSPQGVGVNGISADTTSGTGVYGQSFGSSGQAVLGLASATSGTNYGGSFTTLSTSGTGVFGLASAASGSTYGGYFQSDSTTGIGLYAKASSGTGANYGGYFIDNSTAGIGIFAIEGAATGATFGGRFEVNSDSGRAVYGLANNTGAAATPYGVYGSCSTATFGFGVYALGDMGASGVKPFRIDHPLDPENKYLLHYASESPFPQNFYNGNVTTDESGYAWVELPDYFAEINANFKYQLTVIDESDSDQFIWAKVVQRIKGNRFKIRTNIPHVDVSWEVKADRNDLRIRANRPTDVRDKVGLEKGRYQHPEYYGLGPERGMEFGQKIVSRSKPSATNPSHPQPQNP